SVGTNTPGFVLTKRNAGISFVVHWIHRPEPPSLRRRFPHLKLQVAFIVDPEYETNIVYLEGTSADGTLNAKVPNAF
ncbi:hypothetical protein ACC733_38980, partial [Rhizobium johnstonii]|uniref:hypothetical protein n=1 Tax=Rhizobium johnstonii TaxID=3019933 RepID=UPI003F9D4429